MITVRGLRCHAVTLNAITHGRNPMSMSLLYADALSMAATTAGAIADSCSSCTTEMSACLPLDSSNPYVDGCWQVITGHTQICLISVVPLRSSFAFETLIRSLGYQYSG